MTRSRRPRKPRRPPDPSGKDDDGRRTGGDNLCETLRAYLEHRSHGIDPPAALAEVWDEFYRSSIPRMRARLRRLGLTEADREDCIQDVWSKLLTRPDSLPRELRAAALTSWLLTVARNRAIDAMRRQRLAPAGLDDRANDLVDNGPGPTEVLDRRATRSHLERVLAELAARGPEVSYQVFYLRTIEGRPGDEVAEALGLTPEQVRFRLHRMTQKFRELLDRSQSGEWPGE
ncbi:MAG: RNA polymerase sigma factor [Isosphaeraceae bacterium]